MARFKSGSDSASGYRELTGKGDRDKGAANHPLTHMEHRENIGTFEQGESVPDPESHSIQPSPGNANVSDASNKPRRGTSGGGPTGGKPKTVGFDDF